jgi:hypothetical protein
VGSGIALPNPQLASERSRPITNLASSSLSMPAKKRHSATQAARVAAAKRGERRTTSEKTLADDDDFPLAHSDDDYGTQNKLAAALTDTKDQQEAEEARETAAEKRLRLGKLEVVQLIRATIGSQSLQDLRLTHFLNHHAAAVPLVQ